jgi:hypothetical protein
VSARFRHAYGGHPAHLLGLLVSFAVAGYALLRVGEVVGDPLRVYTWLGGSIVAHDLILFPLYAIVGVAATALLLRGAEPSRLRIAALNHVRVPALLSGLLLLVWFPLVSGKADRSYVRATALENDGHYLERWLVISAALFAASALVFALRARALGRRP